jgi:hypothetical protein
MLTRIVGIPLVFIASLVSQVGSGNDQIAIRSERLIMAQSMVTGAIEGQVFIGPVRSVQRKGEPNQRPYQARITVLDVSGHKVAVADSDDEGKFRIALPPGTYVLRPESLSLYPRAPEQRVTVGTNSISQVEIVYDSGKR